MTLGLILAGVSLILAFLANNRANNLIEESEDVREAGETGGIMRSTLERMLAQYERRVRGWRVLAGALVVLCFAELIIVFVMSMTYVF